MREEQGFWLKEGVLPSVNYVYVLRTLVNMHKAQKSPAVHNVGVSAFHQVVSFVCEDTLRHPPTRQYLSSCVEILGQVRTQTYST